jgi:hypothetical protein
VARRATVPGAVLYRADETRSAGMNIAFLTARLGFDKNCMGSTHMKTRYYTSIFCVSMALGAQAFAQTADVATTRQGTAGSSTRGITAEVKPLQTLLSAIPGVGVVGFGLEGFVRPKTTVYSEVNIINSNLPERLEGAAKDKLGDDKLYANKMRGGAVDIGSRWYNNPIGHSWYTGGKIGYQEASTEWEYNDEVLTQRSASLTPGINAGYRWAWQNNVVVRLGAGASLNLVQAQNVDSENDNADTDEARDELDEAAKVPVLANVDLGLGYMF